MVRRMRAPFLGETGRLGDFILTPCFWNFRAISRKTQGRVFKIGTAQEMLGYVGH